MPITERQMLLNKISQSLSDKLPEKDLNAVMQIVTQHISGYEISNPPVQISGAYPDLASSEYVETFLMAKRIEGRSEKTIEHYRYCIENMLKAVNVPVSSINVYHIRKYLLEEKNRGISDSTIEGNRSVLSCFFGWLNKEGLLPTNPVSNISTIKCAKKIRKPLSDIDIEQIKEACGDDRNRAIFFFLLSTGCRISETCALNRDSIDFSNLECKVLGKGNKERTVYLSSVAAMMLKRYLNSRKDSFPALFIGKGSERMTPGGIRFMFKQVAERAGVDNLHPHRLRRTLATNLINHGMSIQEVAQILGHEKIDTTMKYIYTSQDNVKAAYRKFA